jgi:hypothetical protein
MPSDRIGHVTAAAIAPGVSDSGAAVTASTVKPSTAAASPTGERVIGNKASTRESGCHQTN